MLQHTRFSAVRRSLWNRIRVQLGGGILLAVILPYYLRVVVEAGRAETLGLTNSLFGTFVALLVGYYAFRKVSNYPGVRSAYQIFPAFATSYGVVLAVFFFLRLDYSRFHFASSFAICLVYYYALHFTMRRQRRMTFGVVPFGAVNRLLHIDAVDWIMLSGPEASPLNLDGIVADLRADMSDDWERFLSDRALEGTLVLHAKQLEESLTGRVELEHLSENNLGSLIPGVVYGKIKRAIDIVLSLLALPVLLLLLPLVAVAIKMDSPGPVFFTQKRMGFRGHPFTMIKLRSMYLAGEATIDPRQAAMTQDNDHRVTPLGQYLRRYRIDELPQIINILRGEMSWIGPRPEAVPLSQWYERELPFYRYRHIVRPGVTGWAQVRLGHVAEVSEVMEKLHYDFYYIRNFSFWLDLLIVAATVRIVLGGFGAR